MLICLRIWKRKPFRRHWTFQCILPTHWSNRCLIWLIMVMKPDTDQAEGNCLFSWSMPKTLFYLECLHSTFEYFIRKRFVSGLEIFKSSKRIQEFTNSIEYFKQFNNTNVLDLWKGASSGAQNRSYLATDYVHLKFNNALYDIRVIQNWPDTTI